MKTLKTLIRLKKDEVDILKKELAQLEERKQLLADEHADLTAQLAREAELATQFPECGRAFAAFAKKTIERLKALLRTIASMDTAINKKRDQLLVEYGEQKKFEIALNQRQLAEFNEAKRKESLRMDEVAIRGFVRKE